MIDSSPRVVCDPADLHAELVEVPLPLSASTHRLDPLAPDLGCKHPAKPVPAEPHGLMADLKSAFAVEIV